MNEISEAYSINLFMPNGDPEGIKIATKPGWIGKAVFFPRPLLDDLKKDPRRSVELKSNGVYLLIDTADSESLPIIYIGKSSGGVIERIPAHPDFSWNQCVFFVTTDNSLNDAHVQYLEEKLIKLADSIKRCELKNSQTPKDQFLAEHEIAYMESFLKNILQILPLFGISSFEALRKINKRKVEMYEYNSASGYRDNSGFVILKDSLANIQIAPSTSDSVKNIRNTLVKSGVLQKHDDNHLIFTSDYLFASFSQAAGVIRGGSVSGPLSWKNKKTGRTIKEEDESQQL